MGQIVGTSNNDQPAVTGENTVPFSVFGGVGVLGKGIIGLEGQGTENGVRAQGKTGVNCQGTDTGVNALTGTGVAVRAASVSGIGLEAFGGQLAARFAGDVEVTGNLTVRGATTQGNALEQRISDLKRQLQEVLRRLDATQPKALVLLPEIRVGSGNDIIGSGFIPNHSVTIRAVDDAGFVREFSTISDVSGRMQQDIGRFGRAFIAATDGRLSATDLTGKVWTGTIA
jgi:hypothetical protein